MRKFFKGLLSFITITIILLASLILINGNTLFFREIGTYVPFLEEHFPYASEYISEMSDEVNKTIAQVPVIGQYIIRDVELPINPDDIAANAYYSSDTMLTFNNRQNISIEASGSRLEIYGTMHNERYLVYQFLDRDENVLNQVPDRCDADGEFRKSLDIPDGAYQFTVFTGTALSGEYSSIVYNYIYLEQSSDGNWSVTKPPVYAANIAMFEKDKSISRALKHTTAINSDDTNIIALAKSVTAECVTDYEKATVLHDWVCNNIYYDTDNVGTSAHIPYTAIEVLSTRRAVCEGYANLYAALCRAVEIPCNVVNGYAVEMSDNHFTWTDPSIDYDTSNHAWNEVHIDNRWVIVDSTWDSRNKIKNGTAQSEGSTSYLYFDANIRFFSQTHKIIKYVS